MTGCLVMAGGRGSRLGLPEKPLVELGGRKLIDYVLGAAHRCKGVDEVVCLTSPHTPLTTSYISSMGVETIVCGGRGYLADLMEGLKRLSSDTYVVCSCDIPFITSENIEEALREQLRSGSPYVFMVVPTELPIKMGIKPTTVIKLGELEACPAGIRVVVSDYILKRGWIDPLYVATRDERLAVNINTREDLAVAERIVSGSPRRLDDRRRL